MRFLLLVLLILSKSALLITGLIEIGTGLMYAIHGDYSYWKVLGSLYIAHGVYCLLCCFGLIKGNLLLTTGIIINAVLVFGIGSLFRSDNEAGSAFLKPTLFFILVWVIHSLVRQGLTYVQNKESENLI